MASCQGSIQDLKGKAVPDRGGGPETHSPALFIVVRYHFEAIPGECVQM